MPPWAPWEAYAHLVADLAVRQRDLFGLELPPMPYTRPPHVVDACRTAFIEGWAGSFKACTGVYEPAAYQAGQLARLVYEDRRTSVTRIIEFLAAHPRGRYTVEQINRLVFYGHVALSSTCMHLRWCEANHYVDRYEAALPWMRGVNYRYRPAATRPR